MVLFLLSTGFFSRMPTYTIPLFPRCSQGSWSCIWLADALFSFTSQNFPKESFLGLWILWGIVTSGGIFLFFLPCFFGTTLEWLLPCFDLNMAVIVRTSLKRKEMSLYCGLFNNFMYNLDTQWANTKIKVRYREASKAKFDVF